MKFLVAALIFSLAACGSGTNESNTSDAAHTVEDTPPLYNYSSIKAAMAEAQSTAHVFWTHHADWGPGEDGFRVKILQTSDEYTRDYVWVEYLQEDGAPGEWRGSVSIENGGNDRFRTGDTLSFSEGDVVDWAYNEDGKIRGAYTSRAMLELAPNAKTDNIRALYHESPVP